MVSESTIGKCPYEVGDVLTTRNAADPATRWPGTSWQRITDRFILGAGGSYGVGATGGEASHVLTVNEMPEHAHGLWYAWSDAPEVGGNWKAQMVWSTTGGAGTWPNWSSLYDAASTGGSAAHNNMPPYLALYIWERTA